MSHQIPGTAYHAEVEHLGSQEAFTNTASHAFSRSQWEGCIPKAPESGNGVPSHAPYTNLAHAGHNQWESTPAHQPSFGHFGVGYALDQFQDPWASFAQGNAYGYTGNHEVPLPSAQPFTFNHIELAGQAIGRGPTFDFNQLFFLQGGAVENFDFQPSVLQAQPQAFVAPAQVPNVTPVQLDANNRLHCPLGCSATFGRPGDYRRHMRKHETPRYKCMVIECDRTFARADKLRDHMRQGHRLRL